jgi:hypothetical protein
MRDRAFWGRPERANMPRPVTTLTAGRPGTEVAAMAAAALAAASIAVREESVQVMQACILSWGRAWCAH